MATVLAATMAVAQVPEPAPVPAQPAVEAVAPVAAAKPVRALKMVGEGVGFGVGFGAQAPVKPVAPLAPSKPRIVGSLADLADLDMKLADLDLNLDLDINVDAIKLNAMTLAGQADELSARITKQINSDVFKYALDAAEMKTLAGINPSVLPALAPLAKLAQQDPDRIAERVREQTERAQERAQEAVQRSLERSLRNANEDTLYRRGTSFLDEKQWDKAVETFDEVIRRNSPRADGATYWKAWAQYKQGNRDASLASLKTLTTTYPNSRWLADAKALTVEVGGPNVNPNDPTNDEETKTMAFQALMRNDPDKALPIGEKMLKGSGSPRFKDRILFIIASEASNAKARELITQIARGAANPDLQPKAITYLAHTGRDSKQALSEIYNASSDVTVKKRVLQAYIETQDKEHLLAVAKSDPNADLRMEAIRYLGNMGAHDEVYQLYGSEQSSDIKKQIINSMYAQGFSPKVAEIARTEKDPTLRKTAIRVLGNFGASQDLLYNLYDGEKDDQNRKEIVRCLANRQAAKQLVDIGRKETNPELKREIVSHLSHMKNNKEATDFLMEILNK